MTHNRVPNAYCVLVTMLSTSYYLIWSSQKPCMVGTLSNLLSQRKKLRRGVFKKLAEATQLA